MVNYFRLMLCFYDVIRKKAKALIYGRLPGFAGRFPYFGEVVYFPRRSVSFYAACEQGIYEKNNVQFLTAWARPETTVFDVGANIGLMAIPVLRECPTCAVVSFEPSPTVLPFLRRTIGSSSMRGRWSLVEKAVADLEGDVDFSVGAPEDSLFDGIRSTRRRQTVAKVQVPVVTIDLFWESRGCPAVSVIKCDVEGAELAVLRGSRQCLKQMRPAVLIEWNAQNLEAYDCAPDSILSFCEETQYRIFSVPAYVEIHDATELALQMMLTENFALLPQS